MYFAKHFGHYETRIHNHDGPMFRETAEARPSLCQVMHEFNRGWELQDIHDLLREINRRLSTIMPPCVAIFLFHSLHSPFQHIFLFDLLEAVISHQTEIFIMQEGAPFEHANCPLGI